MLVDPIKFIHSAYWPLHDSFSRSELSELYKPLEDPLITSCMEILDLDKDRKTQGSRVTSAAKNIWAKFFPKPQRCWLPTGCLVRNLL